MKLNIKDRNCKAMWYTWNNKAAKNNKAAEVLAMCLLNLWVKIDYCCSLYPQIWSIVKSELLNILDFTNPRASTTKQINCFLECVQILTLEDRRDGSKRLES